MRLSSTLPTTTTLCICIWTFLLCLLHIVEAAGNETHPELICVPFGICEPCPADSLQEPFCQPFGNRRLMHCQNASTTTPPNNTPNSNLPDIPNPQNPHHPGPRIGEIPAWESCGRIVNRERADFYEFVGCNLFFAAVAIGVVFVRSRRLRMLQARQLAARIGFVRGGGSRR